MKFGLNAWTADYAVAPAELAQVAEQHGFESLFVPEHTHIPVSRETEYIGGGALPDYYADTYDPFVALTSAAAATTSLLVGTGICLIVERDPILLARESATLDRLSEGRLLLGVGAGWNFEEMRNHGTDPKVRFTVLAERVEAIKAIWTESEPEYHGRFVSFDPIYQRVTPVQRPGPPVLVGMDGSKCIDRVIAYGDGWFPTVRGERQAAAKLGLDMFDLLGRRIAELRERAAEAGRGGITVTLNGAEPDPRFLEACAKVGVDRVLFVVEPVAREVVLPRIAALADLMRGHATELDAA